MVSLALAAVLPLAFVGTLARRNYSRVVLIVSLSVWVRLLIRLLKVYSEYTYWPCPDAASSFATP
jgi:hypothetical protein